MKERLKPPRWQELETASIITEPGTGRLYKTGDWKTQIPITDREVCIRCGVCWIYCPDMCRTNDEQGYYDVNSFYCKGCGICAAECPTGAIRMSSKEEDLA